MLTIRNWDAPNYRVKKITQTARETYHLTGGTIVTLEAQTIHFARDQHHTTAIFSGRVIGGSGRFVAHRGTIEGGCPGVDGRSAGRIGLLLITLLTILNNSGNGSAFGYAFFPAMLSLVVWTVATSLAQYRAIAT